MNYILLIIGFLFLIKGADIFVEGSSSIAKSLKISPMLIGLTIVAFGTSSPEAAVSINAAIKGSNEIVIANIVGSSIFNIMVVLGVVAVIKKININHITILKELPFLLLASLVLYVLSLDHFLEGHGENLITRSDGIILLAFFLIYMYYIIETAFKSKEDYGEDIKTMSLYRSILFLILGILAILVGGKWVVISSTKIALSLGMSETLVGLTIVAIGTSLPELTTSIVAAYKGESDIAVGNVIGSNIFNILLVLGITTVIKPIAIENSFFLDMVYLLFGTVAILVFSISRKSISRFEGALLTLSYIGYMVYIIIRN